MLTPNRFALLIFLLFATSAPAAEDKPGSSDHPLFTRFPGAVIQDYDQRQFDEAVLPRARIDDEDAPGDLLALEGKVTRIAYRIPYEKTATEVARNYAQALKKGGFEIAFQCHGHGECGESMSAFIANSGQMQPPGFGDVFFSDGERVLLAKRENAEGLVHAFFYFHTDTANRYTIAYEQVVEAEPMDTDQVTVLDADQMKRSLEQEGRVAVYGVHFDTGKAVLTPDSEEALEQMKALLEKDSALKVFIVGHTDSVGDFDSNLSLSSDRAKAVMDALRTRYGIQASRMQAKGIASLAPVATNASEDGRALNRRVELVVR